MSLLANLLLRPLSFLSSFVLGGGGRERDGDKKHRSLSPVFSTKKTVNSITFFPRFFHMINYLFGHERSR